MRFALRKDSFSKIFSSYKVAVELLLNTESKQLPNNIKRCCERIAAELEGILKRCLYSLCH